MSLGKSFSLLFSADYSYGSVFVSVLYAFVGVCFCSILDVILGRCDSDFDEIDFLNPHLRHFLFRDAVPLFVCVFFVTCGGFAPKYEKYHSIISIIFRVFFITCLFHSYDYYFNIV